MEDFGQLLELTLASFKKTKVVSKNLEIIRIAFLTNLLVIYLLVLQPQVFLSNVEQCEKGSRSNARPRNR